ncbi:ABC transporter ATP-binding protein [Meiothermus taiwanensis]|jgi:branched-chain amino acid transport system ATP-binding protein|uniref:Lipopolysaccharide export system ATP-binding protein LptB n=2 Tax=Meiothermus taiwanensis TaxID=172827 RepID=A0A399DS53_9DEIN|nr:ABC transporter ATP-binding protein [Meiothermus taiwanensis]AWR87231.1 ABC transporter related protein [Meiothermus taiwanensis WR-220]KIQ53379.1 ABC transporter [Meiothermus taiwanensis]KZK15352.1 ABC transporter ATP-binding protein [Meiothermus taiwanensis]RIH74827.1 Lipopolysaccharide export system ATP-binding protein LptB [Meiothermus taiwanensis]
MSKTLLEAHDLHLSFRGVKALVGVSFSVSEGDLFAVIGPNGAGKTSLLNVLSGLYRPQQGRVVFLGEDLAGQSPQQRVRKGLGRTFQNLELFRGMTVLDNVKLGAELAVGGYTDLVPKAQIEWKIRHHAEEVLDYLHLSPYRHVPAGALPYGLQKRVEVARALAGRPKLLLLDEPMAGLSLEEKQDLARFLLDARREWGVTLVLVEHDLRAVLELSTGVLVMSYGEVLYQGAPAGVRENPRVAEAYLGRSA